MSKDFDWIELHKKLHNSRGANPQMAIVCLEERLVTYRFFHSQIEPETGRILHATPNEKGRTFFVGGALGFTTALKLLYPLLEFEVKDDNEKHGTYAGEVTMKYKARTQQEIKDILVYIRKVPEDGGTLPKPRETSFIYD